MVERESEEKNGKTRLRGLDFIQAYWQARFKGCGDGLDRTQGGLTRESQLAALSLRWLAQATQANPTCRSAIQSPPSSSCSFFMALPPRDVSFCEEEKSRRSRHTTAALNASAKQCDNAISCHRVCKDSPTQGMGEEDRTVMHVLHGLVILPCTLSNTTPTPLFLSSLPDQIPRQPSMSPRMPLVSHTHQCQGCIRRDRWHAMGRGAFDRGRAGAARWVVAECGDATGSPQLDSWISPLQVR
ncbi:hypothetical protein EDD21DRAFT_47458 [Dissophora ornata]|nr:hypothetical protein EDD21DRAFT_47458 [Dissophora ornata]